jgi:hypothetical protein
MYNTMMFKYLSTTGALLSLALLPLTAQAYITPEEELDEGTYSTRFYEEPPRDTQAAFEEQQRISAERREAELNAIKPQPEPEEMHEAAPEEEQTDLDKMIELIKLLQSQNESENTPEPAPSSLDPVTQRLLLRIEAQRDAAERASLIQSLLGEDGETLHSGAPLADTGPATVLVVLAVAGAVAETWRRVRKTERAV